MVSAVSGKTPPPRPSREWALTPPPAGSGRRRPSCRSISSQAAMVSRSCRCRCSTASSSCWARSSRGGCGGGLPPSPSPAFPRSTPAASLPGRETASGPALGDARSRPQPTAPRAHSHPRDQPAPGPHSIAARATSPPALCSLPPAPREDSAKPSPAPSPPFSFKSPGRRGPFKLPGAKAGPSLAGRKLGSCVTSSRKRVWTDVYCASLCGAEGRSGGRHGAKRRASGLWPRLPPSTPSRARSGAARGPATAASGERGRKP